MNEQYTIEEFLTLAKNVLNIVQETLAQFNYSNDYVNNAEENIDDAIGSLESYELEGLVEYQMALEYLLDSDDDPTKKPNLDDL